MIKRTILTILVAAACAAPLSAIDRGLGDPESVYIPKGTVAASLTGGYFTGGSVSVVYFDEFQFIYY